MVFSLTTFVIVSLLSYITCMGVKSSSLSGKQDLESENMQGVVTEKHLLTTGNASVLKTNPDCDSGKCESLTENSGRPNLKVIVHRHRFVRTSPKSFNFLATLPTKAPSRTGSRRKLPREKIHIYKLEEEVKKSKGEQVHDWPMEYDYEMENPDSKIYEEKNEEEIEYVDIDDTKSTQPDVLGITVTNVDEFKDKYFSETDETTQGTSKFYGKTVQQKPIPNKKEDRDFATPSIKFIKKKDKSKLYEKGKLYRELTNTFPVSSEPVTLDQSTNAITHLPSSKHFNVQKHDGFGTSEYTTTEFINTYTKRKHKVNRFPFGLLPNSNNSFNIFRYPIYFTAKPILHEDKMVIPYPYFVLKTDQKELPRAEEEVRKEKETDDDVLLEISENPQTKKINVDKDVEIVYDVDYMEMENDEDYVPSTEEDYEDITHIIDITSQAVTDITGKTFVTEVSTKSSSHIVTGDKTTHITFKTPLTSHPIFVKTTENSKNTFHFNITGNRSTKYPDPYRDGTLYNYYDCSLIASRANIKSGHETQHLTVTIVFIYFFVNIIKL